MKDKIALNKNRP